MWEEIRSAILSAIMKVFEMMYFIPIDSPGNIKDQNYPLLKFTNLFRGQVEFKGKESGRLVLYIPQELTFRMADNFLGIERASLSNFELEDMIGELCNMVCGNFLSNLDRKSAWYMNPPTIGLVTYQDMEKEISDPSNLILKFLAEGYEIKVMVQYRG